MNEHEADIMIQQPKNSYSKEELLLCSEGKLFGPGNAQLPAPNMLMADRIVTINDTGGEYKRGEIHAQLDIHPDLWFFQCHFPGDPVMPGCLGLDAMWQLVGFFLGWKGNLGRGRALGCGDVRFTGQVQPDAKLVDYRVDIRRIVSRSLVMGIANANMFVDGELIYQAHDLRVGLFLNEEKIG